MNIEKLCQPLFWISLISGVKLILNAFGVAIISDEQANDIANGLAAIFTVVGVASSWSGKEANK